MSRYPSISSGEEFTSEILNAMIEDVYVKANTTDRASNTTLADDTDLAGIALPEGTFWIRLRGFFTTPTTNTQKLKTRWAFTGTWNNPIRMIHGPGSSNTAASTDMTTISLRGVAAGSDTVYGGPASAAFNLFEEESFQVVVTVAGDLSLQWAQNASSANVTSVKTGSAFIIKQIA